ncbi:hypothetical protein KC322_g84 [Hortaea werneckii]|nr:hypothetical protein KC322_g84 [Hortaea werneckii]
MTLFASRAIIDHDALGFKMNSVVFRVLVFAVSSVIANRIILYRPFFSSMKAAGILTENLIIRLLESSLRIASTHSAKTPGLSATSSVMGLPSMSPAAVPVISRHDGLTHLTLHSRSSSSIAFMDCSAALRPCGFLVASPLRAATAGGASMPCGGAFGCARRHSVASYANIARRPIVTGHKMGKV